ncbi:hypothetical protein F0U44_09715 [Nocardioides humilatus]|uniref:Protein kinase domain-containing protein n=1 Tax=Nocardioides humilatus TaxID=2607660 RepID=A0A5B1LEW6_9ACTN|nr:hypothetical protein [Nocardioides humilatus]KAA1418758.1 hypothetical protein F0U44_09715 [Nocardioides humilatus]
MTASAGLSDEQVLAIGRGLLTELARLHEAGGVCGAVGASSVLVDEAGGVHLAQGAAIDPGYASPEVLSGQPPTVRSDLYSAAALLAHLFRGAPSLPPRVDDLDPGVAWLLGPVLVPDPAHRPGSAADMVLALDQLAQQRHGQDWRAGAVAFGAVVTAGAVPLLVLATSGSASAATAAGVAGAAGSGVASGAIGGGAAGSAVGGAGGGGSAVGAVGSAGHVGGHGTIAGLSKGAAIKIGAGVAAGAVGIGGVATAVVVLSGPETHDVKVPGTSDIYLAGAGDEEKALLSDPGTAPVKVKVDGAGKVTFAKVEGKISACDGCVLESPDGGEQSFAATGVSGFNGIAGVSHVDRTLFLVGVFVGDDQPTQAADAVVDLSEANSQQRQSPDLGEPFFIGNGETSSGSTQEVKVPSDAQTLYLGFADGYGFVGVPGAYGDNQGSISLEVKVD